MAPGVKINKQAWDTISWKIIFENSFLRHTGKPGISGLPTNWSWVCKVRNAQKWCTAGMRRCWIIDLLNPKSGSQIPPTSTLQDTLTNRSLCLDMSNGKMLLSGAICVEWRGNTSFRIQRRAVLLDGNTVLVDNSLSKSNYHNMEHAVQRIRPLQWVV